MKKILKLVAICFLPASCAGIRDTEHSLYNRTDRKIDFCSYKSDVGNKWHYGVNIPAEGSSRIGGLTEGVSSHSFYGVYEFKYNYAGDSKKIRRVVDCRSLKGKPFSLKFYIYEDRIEAKRGH